MNRERLTVIAAACNERVHAPEWLAHLSWADRIVVADTGSRDGTAELLAAAGAEVLATPCAEGAVIHTAKNRAIAAVPEGWILDLDLDERVPIPLRDEIQRVIGDRSVTASAFRIPFRHYLFGRWLEHGGWRDLHLRLYRANRARYPVNRAHSTLEVDGEIAELKQAVVHFAHPTLHDFVVKMNRYTSQDAPLMRAHGRGGLRNRRPLPARRLAWLRAAAGTFWNRYVKAAGYRDGVPGFLAASLLAMYSFVEQAKVWELEAGREAQE